MGRVEAGAVFSCPGDNRQPGFRISALEKTREDNIMGLFKNNWIGWSNPVLFFTFSSNIHEERETACFAAGGAFSPSQTLNDVRWGGGERNKGVRDGQGFHF